MRFYVNVDHVATVRQARRADEPNPVEMAVECEKAGADGITIHLREDRRHIQDDDVLRMSEAVSYLNLELATSPDVLGLALELRPQQATIVPEKREEVTTEGGLDLSPLAEGRDRLREAVVELAKAGSRVSLFIDPDEDSIRRSKELGAPAIELHTGDYANHYQESSEPLERLARAAEFARELGLAVHAGHGLTYRNVSLVAAIPEIEELNIGHSIVARSIAVGMQAAVREMRQLINAAR